jgi:hypothetical protein
LAAAESGGDPGTDRLFCKPARRGVETIADVDAA